MKIPYLENRRQKEQQGEAGSPEFTHSNRGCKVQECRKESRRWQSLEIISLMTRLNIWSIVLVRINYYLFSKEALVDEVIRKKNRMNGLNVGICLSSLNFKTNKKVLNLYYVE